MDKLWAKKYDVDVRNKKELFLIPHLRAVESAGKILCSSIGNKILNSVGLESSIWKERLDTVLPLSCLLHDLGKANNHFQEMITNKSNNRVYQPIRHEFLSVLLIIRSGKKIRNFILKKIEALGVNHTEFLFNSIYSGILAHHLKFDVDLRKACPGVFGDGGYPLELIAYTTHSDLDEIFGIDKPSNDFLFSFLPNHKDKKYKYIKEYIEKFQAIGEKWEETLRENPDWLIFSIVLKPLVICADVIASALVPDGISYDKWIIQSLNNYISENELQKVVQGRLKGYSPRKFQVQISDSRERVTLVEAGCGSGKTIGAYLWALKNVNGNKLYFCYPTTGTATEGFLGYVNESEYEAELIHSRSDVDLEGIQQTGDDEEADVISDKIYALTTYHPKIVICTIDTVLALMKNSRKSILSFPSIATGIFVFDEIHSFTEDMFKAMVSFINLFKNVKFLLMSASLQPERKNLLKREFPSLAEIETPKELMDIKRYKFNFIQNKDAMVKDIISISQNKKVLVVVNTVSRAQEIYRNLITKGINTKIYHSRYKYKDRIERHRDFMKAFQDSAPPVAGIATQVSEMSLDIDSDLLFTELAPVPSLIQRMGRLNRRTSPEKPLPCRYVYFYEPTSNLPYEEEELCNAKAWIAELIKIDEISQNDLQNIFLALNPSQEEIYPTTHYDFTKPNFYFTPATDGLRGASNTINCILQNDVQLLKEKREKLENLIIPMTFNSKIDMKGLSLYKYAFIIPNNLIQYDSIEGAQWLN